jgi:hypothetical protein
VVHSLADVQPHRFAPDEVVMQENPFGLPSQLTSDRQQEDPSSQVPDAVMAQVPSRHLQ